MAHSCFVTATDTGVGKTWVSAGLMCALRGRGLDVAGMKPVASGCRRTRNGLRNDDAELLQSLATRTFAYEVVNPVALPDAVAPHIAAARSGRRIDFGAVQSSFLILQSAADAVVVEGVGGWRVPLADGWTVAHLPRLLGLPVVLVVGLRLGCINHAMLTVAAISADGVPVAGWVANQIQPEFPEATEVINHLCESIPAPLLGTIPFLAEFQPERIALSLATDLLAGG